MAVHPNVSHETMIFALFLLQTRHRSPQATWLVILSPGALGSLAKPQPVFGSQVLPLPVLFTPHPHSSPRFNSPLCPAVTAQPRLSGGKPVLGARVWALGGVGKKEV